MTLPIERAHRRYEDRLVAFVDVLGWSELIRRSVDDQAVFSLLDRGASLMTRWSNHIPLDNMQRTALAGNMRHQADLRFSHFSDTYVISGPAESSHVRQLVDATEGLALDLLKEGHYVRGAIVRGSVVHNELALYGPAVLEAYEIERAVAKYPRIVVTPQACQLFEYPTHLIVDFDGLSYYDVLWTLRERDADGSVIKRIDGLFRPRLERDAERLDLVAKHTWFLSYIDRIRNA